MDCEQSTVHTKFSNISSNLFKLHLKRSSFDSLLKFTHNFADTTVLSNDNTNEPSFSSCNLSSGKQNWRWQIMRVLSIRLEVLIFGIFFDLSRFAMLHSVLFELVRLSCHGSLIGLDARGFQNDSINGDIHACLDFADISHLNVIVMDSLLFSFSDSHYL